MTLVEIVSQHFGQGLLMAAVNCIASKKQGTGNQQVLDGMLAKLGSVNALNNAKTMGLIRLKLSTTSSTVAGKVSSSFRSFIS